jgi:hypothetical protein
MSPEVVQAISGLGALGFAVIAVWALATGRVRVGSLVDAEKKEDRDALLEWKTLAQSTTPELKRLNDLLGTAVSLLTDPRRSDAEVERITQAVRAELDRRKS